MPCNCDDEDDEDDDGDDDDDGSDGGDADDDSSDDTDDVGGDDSTDGYDDVGQQSDDADDTDDLDGTGIDTAATEGPNAALLPPGSYEQNGQWYNANGVPLSWCAECNNGDGQWLSTIATVSAKNGSYSYAYITQYQNAPASYSNNIILNIVCFVVGAPKCYNVPIEFRTTHGNRTHKYPWPANFNQEALQNAIIANFQNRVLAGSVSPGFTPGTLFSLSYDGIIVGYTVYWPGTPETPGPIIISDYYPLN